MELMQLRYFLEVAREQHVTRSAEKLHIAQPALTQALKRLEEDLGVPLFVRKGRNIELNEYGLHLYRSLAPMIEHLDRIPGELASMAKLHADTVRLNVLAASALLTKAIIDYRKSHTGLHFQVFQNSMSDISDILITTKEHHPSSPERRENETVIHEKIYLAAAAEKYGDVDKISFSQVAEEGFISLLGSRQFRAVCDRICRRAGFRPKVIFESDNPTAVQNMIAASMGVGFWPEFTWGKPESEEIKLLTVQDFPCGRDIVIKKSNERAQNAHVNDFYLFLKDYFLKSKTASKPKSSPQA